MVGSPTLSPGIHLARNYVRAPFSLPEELQETFCNYNWGSFSWEHLGSTSLFLLSLPNLEFPSSMNISKNQLTHWLTPCRGKYINLKEGEEKM